MADMEALVRRMVRQAMTDTVPRIIARVRRGYKVFDGRLISRFCVEHKYVVFSFDSSEYVLDESLSALQERLEIYGFLRVHRNSLVNLNQVRCVRRQAANLVLDLSDGQEVGVSRRMRPELYRRLQIRLAAGDSRPNNVRGLALQKEDLGGQAPYALS